MLVMVESDPRSAEGQQAVRLAAVLAADLILLQNGVYFALPGRLGAFRRTPYVITDDLRLRGIKTSDLVSQAQEITYDALVDLMTTTDNVIGAF
jgi:sulfur relay protein TusB/DsrH